MSYCLIMEKKLYTLYLLKDLIPLTFANCYAMDAMAEEHKRIYLTCRMNIGQLIMKLQLTI